jgi:hypothetical protein
MARPRRRRTTVLTVDTGPDHGKPRFYRLVIDGRGADEIREDLLVADGEELRTAHRHESLGSLDDAA